MAEELTREDLEQARNAELRALVKAWNERNFAQVVVKLRAAALIDERIKPYDPVEVGGMGLEWP